VCGAPEKGATVVTNACATTTTTHAAADAPASGVPHALIFEGGRKAARVGCTHSRQGKKSYGVPAPQTTGRFSRVWAENEITGPKPGDRNVRVKPAPVARRSALVRRLLGAANANVAVVVSALVVGARILRNAKHTLHAASNTADNATNSAANDSADRTGSAIAMMETVFSTACNALGARGSG